MKVVIPDLITLSKEDRKKLESIPGIKIYDDVINDPKVIRQRIKDAEIVTANFIDLTGEIIQSCSSLKYIISPAKGYEWIDVKSATAKGIKVLNCPTFNAQAVAEHAIALMFAVKRKIVQANSSILTGEYNPKRFAGSEIQGKRLVTIGHGQIGKRILKMAKGLGMTTDFADSKTKSSELDKLISSADVLVLCLPLNDKTRGIINKSRLSLLKKDSILINVARGLVIDQKNLYKVLKKKMIAGAGIDTFANDSNISKVTKGILSFAKLPNVLATPHMAWNTEETSERLGRELIENINSCLRGKPINVVN